MFPAPIGRLPIGVVSEIVIFRWPAVHDRDAFKVEIVGELGGAIRGVVEVRPEAVDEDESGSVFRRAFIVFLPKGAVEIVALQHFDFLQDDLLLLVFFELDDPQLKGSFESPRLMHRRDGNSYKSGDKMLVVWLGILVLVGSKIIRRASCSGNMVAVGREENFHERLLFRCGRCRRRLFWRWLL